MEIAIIPKLLILQKKGKKGKKGKKEKDLTPDRTIESLYEELAQEGIITRFPKTRLSEFMGDFRYVQLCGHILGSIDWCSLLRGCPSIVWSICLWC